MEKRFHLAGLRIDTGQIGTLLQVASPTGEGEIVKLAGSVMLLGDDVFGVKLATECRLRSPTIFATAPGANSYRPRGGAHAIPRSGAALYCNT